MNRMLRSCLVVLLLCGGAATAATVPDTLAQRARACTACHGTQGRDTADGYVPRLAGKPAGYLYDQMRAFRDGRRPHDTMSRLMENLDDRLLDELAGHFAGLEVSPRPTGAPPPSGPAAARGRQIVREGLPDARVPACMACHGEALTGVQPQVPGLLGLPRGYLVAQLGAWRNGSRRARDPDCMGTVAHRLPLADIAVVADWLSSQPMPPQPRAAAAAPQAPPMPCAKPDAPAATAAAEPGPTDPGRQDDAVARGAYLARLGNCGGCHHGGGREDFAGGPGLRTPFGTVFAGNLTPDPDTGLGRWSADDFWQALHLGRSKDGRVLAPVFPYPSYTHLTRADSDALWAYFRALPPVRRARPAHQLRFPYGTQAALRAWQWLSFTPGDARADAGAVAPERARGRYLVTALGHCAECHAPRNRWGARSDEASGAEMPLQGWWAPALRPAPGTTEDDLVALLRDGRNRFGSVAGPMAAVVHRSTQHWREDDLRAVARDLLAEPAPRAAEGASPAPPDRLSLGARLYRDRCAECHGDRGEGVPGRVSPLAGNPGVVQPSVRNLVQMLRHGGFAPVTRGNPRPFGMPPQGLTPAEQAAVITYLRQSWGHRASAVSEVDLLVMEPR